jgi:hypothetical protein
MSDPSKNEEEEFNHLAAGHPMMAVLQKDFERRLLKKV